MKIAAVLARHRRLLALCAVSLLLHLLAIAWIAAPGNPRSTGMAAAPPAALALRLRAPEQRVALPVSQPQAARAATSGPARAANTHVLSAAGTLSSAAAPAATAAPAAIDATAAPSATDAEAGADTLVQMPERYRVRRPPAAHLTYAVTRTLPGQAASAAGDAQLVWQADDERYQLRLDGVLGQLTSEGGNSDAGIAPQAATERHADGSLATARFDQDSERIVFSASPRSFPIHTGSQDRASLLMQLAGMGLAEPDQIRDVIEVYVVGAQDAGIVKFQVLGQEDVESALGTLPSWHLAQVVRPGEARLELWLAPQHSWFPVQLRMTEPDGTVGTQVVTQIQGR
jgi:hypothetical protein